ncbi:MAG: DUF5675 family protein [Leptospiraceae bacterium]|nr:DUF5675 family protein [Leptospiraceae bacterium]
MEITVSRKWKTEKSSIGELSINGIFECYTLEDIERNPKEKKIYGMTAIPKGKYEIAITFSNKFQTYLPLLLKVPNYEGVRIHPGNTDADTLGCILVGLGKGKDMITESRKAFSVLFKKMQAVAKKEKIFITIK